MFRIVHVGSAMMWFGGAIIGGFFLQPTAKALGIAGQPFMDHLMKRRLSKVPGKRGGLARAP